ERRSLLDWVIRPALRTVEGVADVNSLGGFVKTFEVVPDNASLYGRGLSVSDLVRALEANNRNDGAGRLNDGEEVLLLRSQGSIRTLQDLRDIVVKPHPTEPVRVRDVAEVRFGALTRYGGVTRNAEGEAVQGLVLGLRGANAREVVDGVRQKLDELRPGLPDGVSVEVFYDRGNLVSRAVGTVSNALVHAIVLVVVLLVLFLGNLRAALTVALVLPLAALVTFILMYAFDMSANLMSLGGLVIAIGMLVDAAVVMVENIDTHLKAERDGQRVPRLHLVYRAAREVALPVTSGIVIIILVFLPLLTLQGLEGKLFSPVAATIVFALAGSLLLSLTVIPVFASYLLRQGAAEEPWIVRRLQAAYLPALEWSLGHERAVVGIAAGLLVVAGGVYFLVGKAFMPTMDEGDIVVQLEKLPSITLEESMAIDLRVQEALLEIPEIRNVIARTGSDELGLDPMGLNETDSFLQLEPREDWTLSDKEALIDAIRARLEPFVGINVTFTQPIEMRVSEMLTGVRGDLAVKVFGSDQAALNRTADAIVAELQAIEGAEDVFSPANDGAQYYQVNIDPLAVGRAGISVRSLQDMLRAQVEGLQAGTVYEGIRRTPLVVRGPDSVRNSPAAFANLRITRPDGTVVPLGQLATLERVAGPVAIEREKSNRYAVAIANVSGRDLVGFVYEAQQRVAENVDLPTGYYLEWGGEFENQQRAARRLGVVVPVALGLIFLLLFSTFRSVRQAVLVLSNIPFALTGGVLALWLTGAYLSVPASVGFIALLGIAVLNGVVMVTYFNQMRALGVPMEQVVREGARRRLRPVLMTATTAAFGLVPLLFASGPGSEIQRPLAIVVIGGLVTSTLLTLILLPVLYRAWGESSPGDSRDAEAEEIDR
ncbi:MAG: CusA/CzcA family heavy metal efflux RND transporter, partial [Wenzhouxiangella sp.]|nr:CusA/CzcA family heavy metal efflux RND transporter [Wenzhouxiangella sp.]